MQPGNGEKNRNRRREMMENFLEVLTKTADRIPNTIAIVDQNGKRSISYKDFDILVGRVASKLRSLDFPAGSFIVIRDRKSVV